MRKLFILPMTIIIWLVGNSCQKTTADNEPPINPVLRESEVEIPIITSAQTRTFYTSVPDENTIENLDILLFDSQGKFLCWRTTFKINGKLRTTLPVGTGYDAYFLANCRSFIEKILPDEATIDAYKGKIEWETFLEKLIDADPRRLLQNDTSFTSLPMWGILEKQEVKDQVINYWPLLSLIRSVASVDIYIDTAIENFTLNEASLYYVPDRGFLGNNPQNILNDQVQEADSPMDMKTNLILESGNYDISTRSIANKLYLYDNPTNIETNNSKHTRLVIGGEYNGKIYYYPIDFEDAETGNLVNIIRNKKYIFRINSVSGRGYTDKEIAVDHPSVHLNINIIEWDMTAGQMSTNGNYYLWVEKRDVILYREPNLMTTIGVKSNLLSDVITLNFKTETNGPTSTFKNGIRNNRFEVEFINDENGFPIKLNIKALGEFDTTTTSANSDTVVLLFGKIRLEIQISRYNKGVNDWELDGNIHVDLGK